jgi:cytochrome c biogenesis protein CcdA
MAAEAVFPVVYPARAAPARRPWLLILAGVAAVVCLLIAGVWFIPHEQVGVPGSARKTDADKVRLDQIYLDITYATPDLIHRVKLDAYQEKYGQRAQGFLIGINSHVGDIHNCHFAGTLKLVDSNGREYPSLGQPVVVSHHHNMWIAFFPRLDDFGQPIFEGSRKSFTIRADGIGDVPHREYRFELPIRADAGGEGLFHKLGLWLAVVGAMLVVLSPCAVELTAYYTAIIAGSLGADRNASGGAAYAAASAEDRRRVLHCLLAFAGGFTLLYSFSGATVGLIGQKVGEVTEVFGPYKSALQVIGAVLVGYFGLRILGVLELKPIERVLSATTGRAHRALRTFAAWSIHRITGRPAPLLSDMPQLGRKAARITPLSSFLLGIGLSVGCLTCMGGAVIYPLMIFAGTSRWYWGGLTLLLYSAGIAIPMMLITLGVRDLRPAFARRVAISRVLQGASGALLLVIAVLLFFDHERSLFDPVFRLLAKV